MKKLLTLLVCLLFCQINLRIANALIRPLIFGETAGRPETSFVSLAMQEFKGFWFRIIQETDLIDLYSLAQPLVLDYKPKIIKGDWEEHYCHVYGNLTTPTIYEDHSIAKVQNAKGLLTFFILPPKSTPTVQVAPEMALN